MSLAKAAITAAHLRLRPILITSLAFLLGMVPLTVSSGAGSGAQNALGTAVMGGTFLATLAGLFYVPVFFVAVMKAISYLRIPARRFSGSGAFRKFIGAARKA
jgi:multidrug efflux pump